MTQTECQSLKERFQEKAKQGLVDVKFFVANPSEAVTEDVCLEVNRMYAAVDKGNMRPLDFNDSRRS